jgi:hypothetical protein
VTLPGKGLATARADGHLLIELGTHDSCKQRSGK